MKNLSIVLALLALVTVGNSVLAEKKRVDYGDFPVDSNEPTNLVFTENYNPPGDLDTIDREYWNEEMIKEFLDSIEFNKFAVICVYGSSMRELTLQINRKLNEARMLLVNRNIPYYGIFRGNTSLVSNPNAIIVHKACVTIIVY